MALNQGGARGCSPILPLLNLGLAENVRKQMRINGEILWIEAELHSFREFVLDVECKCFHLISSILFIYQCLVWLEYLYKTFLGF